MKSIIYAIAVGGAVGTLAMMAYAAQSFASLFSGLTLWALAPFAGFAVAGAVARNRGVVIAALVAVAVAVLFAGFVYTDAVFIHPHSTSPLAFILVPLYQLTAAAILLIAAFVLRRAPFTRTI